MKYLVFRIQGHQAEVVTNKTVDQKVEQHHRPTNDHPWQRYGYRVSGKPKTEVNQHVAD